MCLCVWICVLFILMLHPLFLHLFFFVFTLFTFLFIWFGVCHQLFSVRAKNKLNERWCEEKERENGTRNKNVGRKFRSLYRRVIHILKLEFIQFVTCRMWQCICNVCTEKNTEHTHTLFMCFLIFMDSPVLSHEMELGIYCLFFLCRTIFGLRHIICVSRFLSSSRLPLSLSLRVGIRRCVWSNFIWIP